MRGARLAVLMFLLAAAGLLYWPTLWSMVNTWLRSETFTHGFLVAPISIYLIWSKRADLQSTVWRSSPLALAVLVGMGFAWLLGRVADVLVVQQFAFVSMIVGVVWLVLGTAAARRILFPLAFLYFAVPIGEGLIPPMMDFTAYFTVEMLRLTGIPVFSDGTFFEIPSGRWSVVEGCSGVRYLIASVFLGTLYAYLVYSSFWRQALFVLLSIIVPIFANGLRAYLIVMIAHLSDMKLALGVDHFIYGWVWFGIVMFLLFWIGTLWRDRERPAETPQRPDHTVISSGSGLNSWWTLLLTGAVLLAVWPVWSSYLDRTGQFATNGPELVLSNISGQKVPVGNMSGAWKPRYIGPTQELQETFSTNGEWVGIYVALYTGAQQQGAELVNSQNVMVVQKHPVWRMPKQYTIETGLTSGPRKVTESILRSSGGDLMTWNWFWIEGTHVENEYLAKLYEAILRLRGRNLHAAGVVIYSTLEKKEKRSRERIRQFVERNIEEIEAALESARPARTSTEHSSDAG